MLRTKVKEEEHLREIRASRDEIGMKTYLRDPMDYAKTLKLRSRVGTWTCQKQERGIPVVGRKRNMYRRALVAKQ